MKHIRWEFKSKILNKKIETFFYQEDWCTDRMNTVKMVTPEDILKEREAQREAGLLAHTSMFNPHCKCDACRDVYDPKGEQDAKARNEALMKEMCEAANIPPPPPTPTLTRQYAICLDCGEQHSCSRACVPDIIARTQKFSQLWKEFKASGGLEDDVALAPPPPSMGLTRQYTNCLSCSGSHACDEACMPRLPPPPPAIRQPYSSTGSSSILSGVTGVGSPTPTAEESSNTLEKKTIQRLKKLRKSYEDLQSEIEQEGNEDGLKHDEMAAYDAWWNELDEKIAAVETLMKLIKESTFNRIK